MTTSSMPAQNAADRKLGQVCDSAFGLQGLAGGVGPDLTEFSVRRMMPTLVREGRTPISEEISV
jgi:hypothetical protein